jgi:hypothetical protein
MEEEKEERVGEDRGDGGRSRGADERDMLAYIGIGAPVRQGSSRVVTPNTDYNGGRVDVRCGTTSSPYPPCLSPADKTVI